MSYAEDNGIDDYSMVDELSTQEELWIDGFHQDKAGKVYEISKMTTKHLINTIKLFSLFDTTPLKEELRKRNQ